MEKQQDTNETPAAAATPLFEEELGAALIDAARISLMAALRAFPPVGTLRMIVKPGDEERPAIHDLLTWAMEALTEARLQTIENMSQPPTSIHLVRR